jgi:putative flippase GtrA
MRFYQIITSDKQPIIPFLTVGATAAFINFSAFSIFWKWFHFDYRISITIAFVLSVVFHFTANRCFTFKSRGMNFSSQFPRYLTMILVNYLIAMAIMHVMVENMHLSPYYGILAAISVTVGISYVLSRFWVFSLP